MTILLIAAVAAAVAGGLEVTASAPHRTATTTTPAPAAVAVAANERTGFVRELDAGRLAGLAGFFLGNPQDLPDGLRTTTRADSQEYRGTGTAAVALDPSALAFEGGHVTVVLVAARSGVVGWRATRLDTRRDWTSFSRRLAVRTADQEAGAPTAATFRYTGAPPMHVRVSAPSGVRWGLLVTITN